MKPPTTDSDLCTPMLASQIAQNATGQRVSPNTIVDWINEDRVRSGAVGGYLAANVEDVIAVIESRKVPA